jgi:hypothetical protein
MENAAENAGPAPKSRKKKVGRPFEAGNPGGPGRPPIPPEVREAREAVRELGKLANPLAREAKNLADLVAGIAATSLAETGVVLALRKLIAALDDPDPQVALAAAKALVATGHGHASTRIQQDLRVSDAGPGPVVTLAEAAAAAREWAESLQ